MIRNRELINKTHIRSWGVGLIFILLALILGVEPGLADRRVKTEKNILTIINRSGEDILVKLIGPGEHFIDVPSGEERQVELPAGIYTYFIRYGQGPDYRYARGEHFEIEYSKTGYTEAALTIISLPAKSGALLNLAAQFDRHPPSSGAPGEQGKEPSAAPVPRPTPPEERGFIVHRVIEGETLPSIAEWYAGQADYWPELAKFNSQLDPYRLKPGTVVRVPEYLAVVNTAPPKVDKTKKHHKSHKEHDEEKKKK